MAKKSTKEIIISYWQTLSIRLKLLWICFGLISSLHATSKVFELICPASCLQWLAVAFILSFFLGMWIGIYLCFDENFNIVSHENSILFTKPLALGIQNLYQSCASNTHLEGEQNIEGNLSQLKDEIEAFVKLIMQDFIHAWYDKYICGEDAFPENVNTLMRDLVDGILARLKTVDQEVLLLHALQEITKHLNIMEKSRHNLKKLRNTSQDKSQHFIVACYETFSVLHPAATSNDSELDYLRSILAAVFKSFLPKNVMVCEPGVLLVREIICQSVLQRAVNLICEPEFINYLVVLLADYVASSSMLEADKEKQYSNSDAMDMYNSTLPHACQSDIGPLSQIHGESLQKDRCMYTEELVETPCQKQKYANQQFHEYSSHSLVPNGVSCNHEVDTQLITQNRRDDHILTSEEQESAESVCKENFSSSHSNYENSPKYQDLEPIGIDKDSNLEVDSKCDEVAFEPSQSSTDMLDQKTGSSFSRTQTFSSLSCFVPFPLPKRAKSPALSNLSRSVDSVMDCEATPGELVAEPAKKKGHSRNSSYPSVIPSDVDFLGNEESTESLNAQESQDSIAHSDSMPIVRDSVDGEEENFCISNLRITSTEQMQEYNSKKTYILYVVEFQVHAPGSVQEETEAIDLQVKRRYREFLTLHWKLDHRQELKKVLKNIKNVPKRFALPIMKKDTAAITQRKITLERYLKQLLDIPAIHTSPEMVEFLALKGNANIAFVHAATSYGPKFDQSSNMLELSKMVACVEEDKILRRRLSEVKQGLKSLAPFPSSKLDVNSSSVVPAEKVRSSNSVCEVSEEDQPFLLDQSLRICSVEEDAGTESAIHVMPLVIEEALSGLDLMIDSLPGNTSDPFKRDLSLLSYSCQRISLQNRNDETEGNNACHQKEWQDLPLYSSILDVIGILQRDPEHWMFDDNVNKVMKKLAGDFVQRFICREVSVLLDPKSWALYLSLIREALWPDGELYHSSDEGLSTSEQRELFQRAQNILLNSYPGVLNILVGEANMKEGISQLFESVQNKQLNKHLIYTFIDHLLEQALPEMKDSKFVEALKGQ